MASQESWKDIKNSIQNQTARITKLALSMNSVTRFCTVGIPKASLIFTGEAAPQILFSTRLVGGEDQIFLLGSFQ